MDVYGAVYGRCVFPLWERGIRRRPTLGILDDLERTQWKPRDWHVGEQVEAVRALLRHAGSRVPLYRERLRAAGIRPEDVRSLDDLHAIEPLSRAEARDAGDARRSEVAPFATIRKATSGSSGEPLAFAYDVGSEHWRTATKLRGYGWAGQLPGVRTMYFWGAGAPVRRSAKQRAKIAVDHFLRRETYVDCGSRSEGALAAAVRTIETTRPEVLVCFAQAGGELARYVNENRLRTWGDIRVICGAEALLESDRRALRRAFGPEVFESYGSREVMLMGMECEAHDGLHVSMENLIVEVVVRENGRTRAARPGEIGEVLVTDLHNYGMPFIRYANGDLARASSGGPCRCGRGLGRIASIEGRVTQTLRDARGEPVSGLAVCSVVAHLGHAIRAFQTVQHEDGSVTLRLVPTPAFDDVARAHLERSLSPYFKGLPFRIQPVGDIPPAKSGKRSIVVVEGA